MGLKERIQEVKDTLELSNSALAKIAKVTPASVTHWLNGDVQQLAAETALNIETGTTERGHGFRSAWLVTGRGAKRTPRRVQSDHPDRVEEPVLEYATATHRQNIRRVAVVGTAKMGDDGYYEEISSIPGAGDGYIEIASSDPDAYVLRVRGNSNYPAIRDGWYVVVEPNASPAVGEFVFVKLRNGRKLVKEFLAQRGGSVEVMSVNGGQRLAFDAEEIEALQPISEIVSPRKWQPD